MDQSANVRWRPLTATGQDRRVSLRRRWWATLAAAALAGGALLAMAGPAQAATAIVNCPTDDLQVAINNASPGDTLVVLGTCKGNFTIDKDLSW